MTTSDKCKLVAIHSAISDAMGDTDPDCGDMTDEEIRRDEPLLWAAMRIARMIGPGPWDKYTSESATLKCRVKHTPNAMHQYTATVKGCGIYGWGNTPAEAKERLRQRLKDGEG
jgi:hypothetical protein